MGAFLMEPLSNGGKFFISSVVVYVICFEEIWLMLHYLSEG